MAKEVSSFVRLSAVFVNCDDVISWRRPISTEALHAPWNSLFILFYIEWIRNSILFMAPITNRGFIRLTLLVVFSHGDLVDVPYGTCTDRTGILHSFSRPTTTNQELRRFSFEAKLHTQAMSRCLLRTFPLPRNYLRKPTVSLMIIVSLSPCRRAAAGRCC